MTYIHAGDYLDTSMQCMLIYTLHTYLLAIHCMSVGGAERIVLMI